MSQNQIKKLLLILSIIFIFLLELLSIKLQPEQIQIEKLNNLTIKDQGKLILTQGQISKTNYNSDYLSFYLKNSSIQFIFFANKFIELKEGQEVQIKGKIDFYRNKTQVIVDKLISLSS